MNAFSWIQRPLPTLADVMSAFVFYYPFLMAYIWMAGGLAFALIFERRRHWHQNPVTLLPSTPMVSVLIPCYNEAAHIREVVRQLLRSRYPAFEIIAVNDGSTDATGTLLDELASLHPTHLRVVHNAHNQGKAVGLNTAALLARGEYILGIDGDALLDTDAIGWLMDTMLEDHRVGAVTGNPRIRNRTTLLGRMQVGEFSATIGLIKRCQQLWGRLFTVSGVIAMFRRKALLEVGLWHPGMMTEDIDVSWRLQLAGWRVCFQPRALAWILMPETLHGLWKQRLRWALGGIQTVLRHIPALLHWRQWRMWPLCMEYLLSVFWSYCFLCLTCMAIVARVVGTDVLPGWSTALLPHWHGALLGTTCVLQMLVSLWIDRYYDRDLLRYAVWTIWYPIAYWLINTVSIITAVPQALLRSGAQRAIWRSPDRGIGTGETT